MSTSQAAGATNADAEIGARISNALIVKGTNQKVLSDLTGIAYPTLRRSLSGGRSLTIRELTSIAEALQVSTSALLPAAITKDAA